MSDQFRTTPPEQQWSGSNPTGNGHHGGAPRSEHAGSNDTDGAGEMGKALVVGLLGGLLSAAGYMVYRRLPDDQKERLHSQVRDVVTQRVNEIRRNFNF